MKYSQKTDDHPHGMRTSHRVVTLRNVLLEPNLLSCCMISYYLSSSSFKGIPDHYFDFSSTNKIDKDDSYYFLISYFIARHCFK